MRAQVCDRCRRLIPPMVPCGWVRWGTTPKTGDDVRRVLCGQCFEKLARWVKEG